MGNISRGEESEFKTGTALLSGGKLVGNNEPRAAFAAVNAELSYDVAILTGRADVGVNITPVRVMPEVVLNSDFDPNLALLHQAIITGTGWLWN